MDLKKLKIDRLTMMKIISGRERPKSSETI